MTGFQLIIPGAFGMHLVCCSRHIQLAAAEMGGWSSSSTPLLEPPLVSLKRVHKFFKSIQEN